MLQHALAHVSFWRNPYNAHCKYFNLLPSRFCCFCFKAFSVINGSSNCTVHRRRFWDGCLWLVEKQNKRCTGILVWFGKPQKEKFLFSGPATKEGWQSRSFLTGLLHYFAKNMARLVQKIRWEIFLSYFKTNKKRRKKKFRWSLSSRGGGHNKTFLRLL